MKLTAMSMAVPFRTGPCITCRFGIFCSVHGWGRTIIADNQDRLIISRTAGNGIDHLLLQPGAVDGHVGRVLGELLRADDDADLGEAAGLGGVVKGVEAGVGVALFAEGGAVGGFLVLLKVGEHVVLEIVEVLPDLPGDAGVFEIFGPCLPDKGKTVNFGLFAA